MKTWQKWLVVLIPFAIIGVAIIAFLIYFLTSESPGIAKAKEKYITLPLYGDILDNSQQGPFGDIFQETNPTLLKYIIGIRKAREDQSVTGLIIRPFNLQLGFAKIEELRDALIDFRQSGKRLIAFLEYTSTRDYYLASTAEEIYMVPNGTLALIGLSAEATFLKDALGKLGVKADFVHIGQYKTAADQYTKNSMSAQYSEVMNRLMDDIYQQVLRGISENYPDSTQSIASLIDQAPLTAGKAQKLQLVDSLLYWDELENLLNLNSSHVKKISFDHFLETQQSGVYISSGNKIALLFASGTIYSGSSGYSPFYGNVIGDESLISQIRRAANDESVKAIVMRIDSPGGSGMASDLIWREVKKARLKKPFVISMADVAASGGYYIAMAADKIVAQPSTITGSIGVISGKFNLKGFYDKIGIKKEQINRGKHANLYSDYKNFSLQERENIRENMQEFYEEFTRKAAEGRNMPVEELEKIAQGQVWSGYRAKQLALVDTLGGLVTAVRVAQEMAGIPAYRHAKILIYPKHKSLLERLIERQITTQLQAIIPFFKNDLRETGEFLEIFKNGEILSLLPFKLELK